MLIVALLSHLCLQPSRTQLICHAQRVHSRTVPKHWRLQNSSTPPKIPQKTSDFRLRKKPLRALILQQTQPDPRFLKLLRPQFRPSPSLAGLRNAIIPNVRDNPIVTECRVVNIGLISLLIFNHINFILIYNLIRMSMIYSLVAREKLVLIDYTAFSGNFNTIALEVQLMWWRCLVRRTCPRHLVSMWWQTIPSIPLSRRGMSSLWWSNQP